mgnify:FL=1
MTSGKNKKNFQIYTAEEFIAAITQHIPEKSFQMVRYYGWYSNKSRGLRKKQGNLKPGDQPLDETDEVIRQILKHLDLWTQTPSRDPPNTNSSPKNHELIYEFFDDLSAFNIEADDWPGYDESCIAQN